MKQQQILLLDGQLFQTEAWDRGMGKYMLQLMKQLSELKSEDMELKILFNSQIDTNHARFETIKYLCPQFDQLFTDLPQAKNKHATSKQYIHDLDNFIIKNLDTSKHLTYMITSLFTFDVFAEFPSVADKKTVLFYDLIPLLNWQDLGGYFPPHLYMARFDRIYEADTIFCISETTRRDVAETFGIKDNKTVNINGGFTEHHLQAKKPVSFSVPSKYILFPSGDLPHKNNEMVFKAFKEVLKTTSDMYLLVTSRFSEATQDKLKKLCGKNIIFTGNVSDEELQYLYKNATMVLFASKYEGLGLPILDAVFHEKPIVASSIAVFEEMSREAFFSFDADNFKAASKSIIAAMDKRSFAQKKKHYAEILAKYDWKIVGKTVLSDIENVAMPRTELVRRESPKVAIVSINPGIKNTIGRVAEQLYGGLRGKAILSYYFDSCGLRHDEMERPTFLDHVRGTEVYDIKRLTLDAYRKYDVVVYLLDDIATNYAIMQYVAALPGYVVYNKTMDTASPMYKVALNMSLGVCEIDNRDYSGVIEYILQSSHSPKKDPVVRLLKSHLPMSVKRARLKRSKGLKV